MMERVLNLWQTWLGLTLGSPQRAIATALGLGALAEAFGCAFTYYLPLVLR